MRASRCWRTPALTCLARRPARRTASCSPLSTACALLPAPTSTPCISRPYDAKYTTTHHSFIICHPLHHAIPTLPVASGHVLLSGHWWHLLRLCIPVATGSNSSTGGHFRGSSGAGAAHCSRKFQAGGPRRRSFGGPYRSNALAQAAERGLRAAVQALGAFKGMTNVPESSRQVVARPALTDFHARLKEKLFPEDEPSCWKGMWDPKASH